MEVTGLLELLGEGVHLHLSRAPARDEQLGFRFRAEVLAAFKFKLLEEFSLFLERLCAGIQEFGVRGGGGGQCNAFYSRAWGRLNGLGLSRMLWGLKLFWGLSLGLQRPGL